MNKLIATAALSFCATLSAMENPDNTIILKTPAPQVLHKTFKNIEQTSTRDSKLTKIENKKSTKLKTHQTSVRSWTARL